MRYYLSFINTVYVMCSEKARKKKQVTKKYDKENKT